MENCPPTLFVVATPIGNLEDVSLRALRVLGEVGALACEDTRRTRRIYEKHDVPSPKTIFSYREHNEESAGTRILRLLNEGVSVALCSDAGYPGISDPGYRIVSAVTEQGYRVEVVPGASAVDTALVASGLPMASYTFKGFPPRRSGPRVRWLESERDSVHTLVIFESPRRVEKLLSDAHKALGDRRAATCIELTKKFEEVHRGTLSELRETFANKHVRGEVTVVIDGLTRKGIQGEDAREVIGFV